MPSELSIYCWSFQVLPEAFGQSVSESGLTLAELQTGVEHGLTSGDTVILGSQPATIATHLGNSSILLPNSSGCQTSSTDSSSILLSHSSSNIVSSASSVLHRNSDSTSLLHGAAGSSIILQNSSGQSSGSSLSQDSGAASATILTIPNSSGSRVLTVHQQSVIQGPGREESANVTSVIQSQSNAINPSSSSRYSTSISSRQNIIDHTQDFNSLSDPGGLEMVTLPTSIIDGNSQNGYTSHVIHTNLHLEDSKSSIINNSSSQLNSGKYFIGNTMVILFRIYSTVCHIYF